MGRLFMIADLVEQRLAAIDLAPPFREALVKVIAGGDKDPYVGILRRLPLDVFHTLGGKDDRVVLPFAAAWATLHVVLLRLDHLQDDDPEHEPLPTTPHISASYNLILAAYVLANALLDDLDSHAIPFQRIQQLRCLWNDCLLVSASGQHQDLIYPGTTTSPDVLDQYQQMAHAKSGALFALAFAGGAILATDDAAAIAACQYVGNIFGALLQLVDDLVDHRHHGTRSGFGLYQAFEVAAHQAASPCELDDVTVDAYFRHVYAVYLQQVDNVLMQLEQPRLTTFVRQLFGTCLGGVS